MNERASKALYITYDGLLDQLGSSQILPYLFCLAQAGQKIHILSFEKRDRLLSGERILRHQLSAAHIEWSPLTFTSRLGFLGKCWDLVRMYLSSLLILVYDKPAIVHARGHSCAQVGLLLKRISGLKLLFDFRGLWVDERVDKGSWRLDNPFDLLQYRIFKSIERKLLRHSDHVVVLTRAVVPEVLRLGISSRSKISVIPCCADFNHFRLATNSNRLKARSLLGIPPNSLVLCLLGSVGGMYLTQHFLKYVSSAIRTFKNLHVLVLTSDTKEFQHLLDRHITTTSKPSFHIHSADRTQVAEWLPASDVLVSFISPTYARIGASPTKLAEAWACGIPTLCNTGVGDVTSLIRDLDAGLVIDLDSEHQFHSSVHALPALIKKGGQRLRIAARSVVSLELASERYTAIYRLLSANA